MANILEHRKFLRILFCRFYSSGKKMTEHNMKMTNETKNIHQVCKLMAEFYCEIKLYVEKIFGANDDARSLPNCGCEVRIEVSVSRCGGYSFYFK